MRTTSMINNNNSLLYINRNFAQLSKVTSQVAMQQQVIELEDDPLSANIGIKMLGIIAKSEQYNRNIKSGIGMLSLSDGYLGSMKSNIQSLHDIVLGAANAPAGEEEVTANAMQVNEILRSLISAGNQHDGTRYMFGGTSTTKPPFTVVNGRYVQYTGNDKDLNILVDNNTSMPINVNGSDTYGNMSTTIPSKDMNPRVNLSTDHSTPLSDLNAGQGVPKGKIIVRYSAFPDGLEVDLTGCDTLEDVKDKIEQTTMDASKNLDPTKNAWLNGETMDWHDMQDRYVKVTMNPDGSGISLQERDMGTPLPEPTEAERRRGIGYSGRPGYVAGGAGIAAQDAGGAPAADGLGDAMPDGDGYSVHNRLDYVNFPKGNSFTNPLRVDDYALNKVAAGLGIKGMATMYDPAHPNPKNEGFLHGNDLDPALSENTLLSDLEGYNDGSFTFTNGGKPGTNIVKETSQDGGVFDDWKLSGLSKGDNTGPNGELYARAVNKGTAQDPRIEVEIYTKPIDQALASDLVATGVYEEKAGGGTVILEEANNSGLSGAVGIVLPPTIERGEVDLRVDFHDELQATVHVPAFEEEQNAKGQSKDTLNIASGWNIQGLDRPPAVGYDENHPVTTDLNGNVSVNYRYDEASNSMIVELSRPASGNTPAAIIASGSINLGENAFDENGLHRTVSGRIELIGAPGFEQVSGSVFLELPKGLNFTGSDAASGTGADNPTQNTYGLTADAPAGTVVLGGATRFKEDIEVNSMLTLKEDTVFKKGQIFANDVPLPGGGYIRAGTPLAGDTTIPKGAMVEVGTLLAGTTLAAGQEVSLGGIPAGTIIPQGSYYVEPEGAGFPAEGMGMYVNRFNPSTGEMVRTPSGTETMGGYNIRATFATVQDLQREIEQAGVYVRAGISDDGKNLEFTSSLAGAWLTVSEDIDGYEQMGDTRQQLESLNLNGLVKGANTDASGNVHTEVVYYPPDPVRPDDPVRLVDKDGKVTEIAPGYYVRVYSDPAQMEVPYEDRDNSKLVAEGFVPAGRWNPDFSAEDAMAAATAEPPEEYNVPPFITEQDANGTGLFANGVMDNLVLEERNDSGVWGTVDLNYHGGRPAYEVVENVVENADGKDESRISVNYSPDNNRNITVYPGGLRPEGADSVLMQEWDIQPVQPGVNCDYSGTFHGKVTGVTVAGPDGPETRVAIELYKDSSKSVMSAKNDPEEAAVNGKVTLYAVDRDGKFALTADGERIVAGTVALPNGADRLSPDAAESFEVKTGALRHGGQHREQNVFSTINDIMDALDRNDKPALSQLLGEITIDENRVTSARGEAGARNKRLALLSERHADDVLNFTATLTSRVGMDDQALSKAIMNYQASTNAYQAAMDVSARVMQMSLLQYLQ